MTGNRKFNSKIIDKIQTPITGWIQTNNTEKKAESLWDEFKIKEKINDDNAKLNIP